MAPPALAFVLRPLLRTPVLALRQHRDNTLLLEGVLGVAELAGAGAAAADVGAVIHLVISTQQHMGDA